MTRLVSVIFASVILLFNATAPAQPPIVSGFEINWIDEFEADQLDLSRWTPVFSTSPTNNSLQAYLPENVIVANGKMFILSTNQPFAQFNFRSGQVISNSAHRYGRFEIRANLPTSRGMWPAIWLLPDQPPFWPSQGEIDIMENRGNQPFLTSSAFHYGTNPPFVHNFVYSENETFLGNNPVNYHDSFHDYAAEWDPEQIRFYVDGVHYYTVRNSNVGGFLTGGQTNPMRLIINTAIGGDFLPNPDASTQWPQTLQIEHVYVYDRVGDPILELENPGFEANGGTLSSWSLFGNFNNNVRGQSQTTFSGNGALKVYGQFSNTVQNFSGVEQGISVQPGDDLRVSARSFVASNDSIAGTGNEALLKFDFYNTLHGAYGTSEYVSSQTVVIANGSTPNNQWIDHELSTTVPANAIEARLAIVFRQVNSAGGAVFVDDIQFENLSATTTIHAHNLTVENGDLVSGGVGETTDSDDNSLQVLATISPAPETAPVQLAFGATAPAGEPSAIRIRLESSANLPGLVQSIEALNFDTGQYELVGSGAIQTADSAVSVDLAGDLTRFVNDSSNLMILRTSFAADGPTWFFPWKVRIDEVAWDITP